MNLILTETRSVITPGELRAAHPDVSFPPDSDMNNEMLQDYGAAVLEEDSRPDLQPLESLEYGDIREEGGHWIRTWIVVPADPDEVAELITSTFEQAIQAHLNAAAVNNGYDDIMTAISYAEEPAVPRFQNDGKAFRAWRSLVWAYAYEQLAEVKAGARAQPTIEEFLGELPALVLTR
jgi:hypothetical protein